MLRGSVSTGYGRRVSGAPVVPCWTRRAERGLRDRAQGENAARCCRRQRCRCRRFGSSVVIVVERVIQSSASKTASQDRLTPQVTPSHAAHKRSRESDKTPRVYICREKIPFPFLVRGTRRTCVPFFCAPAGPGPPRTHQACCSTPRLCRDVTSIYIYTCMVLRLRHAQ